MTAPSYTRYTVQTTDGPNYNAEPADQTILTIGDTWVTITGRGEDTWIPVGSIAVIEADPATRTTSKPATPDTAWNLPQNRTGGIPQCEATHEGDGLGTWTCVLHDGHDAHHRDENGACWSRGLPGINAEGHPLNRVECTSTAHAPGRNHYCRWATGHHVSHSDGAKTWA